MKKLVFIISCLSVVNLSSAQSVFDNFDAYTAGEYLGVQSNGLWTTWNNNPGEEGDVFVSDEYSLSGNNSIKIMSGDSVDLILPLGNVNTGHWIVSFMMRIESGYGAYFNMLHEVAGAESNWAFEAYFSQTGSGTFDAGNSVKYNFTHPTGEWFKIKVDINVDANPAILSINDTPISESTWAWCLGTTGLDSTIAALNLVSTAPEGEEALFYIDNVSFQQTYIGIEELNNAISLYPNPVSNQFTIKTENLHGAAYEIVSILGTQVYKKTLSSNQEFIDCSTWAPGIYFLQITNHSGSVQRTKFIVE
jgi:hypothetical protein